MITEKEIRLTIKWIEFHFVKQFAELRRGQLVNISNFEIHWKLHFVVVHAVHLHKIPNRRFVGFADQDGIAGIAVHQLANLAKNIVYLRQVIGVLVLDVGIAIRVLAWKYWIIVQVGI